MKCFNTFCKANFQDADDNSGCTDFSQRDVDSCKLRIRFDLHCLKNLADRCIDEIEDRKNNPTDYVDTNRF